MLIVVLTFAGTASGEMRATENIMSHNYYDKLSIQNVQFTNTRYLVRLLGVVHNMSILRKLTTYASTLLGYRIYLLRWVHFQYTGTIQCKIYTYNNFFMQWKSLAPTQKHQTKHEKAKILFLLAL